MGVGHLIVHSQNLRRHSQSLQGEEVDIGDESSITQDGHSSPQGKVESTNEEEQEDYVQDGELDNV